MGKKNLTEPKALSKKLRYGGLGKLRLYCDLCQFQARDPQSYKSHVQSESHRMKMADFRANQPAILNSNSHEFEMHFLSVLKNSFPNKEVHANKVYVRVIADKHHRHMTATRWESVRGFCEYLKRCGKIEMRMTENGPMIKYVNKDIADLQLEKMQKETQSIIYDDLKHQGDMIDDFLSSMQYEESEDEEVKEEQKVDLKLQLEQKSEKAKVCPLFGKKLKK